MSSDIDERVKRFVSTNALRFKTVHHGDRPPKSSSPALSVAFSQPSTPAAGSRHLRTRSLPRTRTTLALGKPAPSYSSKRPTHSVGSPKVNARGIPDTATGDESSPPRRRNLSLDKKRVRPPQGRSAPQSPGGWVDRAVLAGGGRRVPAALTPSALAKPTPAPVIIKTIPTPKFLAPALKLSEPKRLALDTSHQTLASTSRPPHSPLPPLHRHPAISPLSAHSSDEELSPLSPLEFSIDDRDEWEEPSPSPIRYAIPDEWGEPGHDADDDDSDSDRRMGGRPIRPRGRTKTISSSALGDERRGRRHVSETRLSWKRDEVLDISGPPGPRSNSPGDDRDEQEEKKPFMWVSRIPPIPYDPPPSPSTKTKRKFI